MQDDWVRAIAAEVLSTNRPIGEAALSAVYGYLLAEKRLSPESPTKVSMLVDDQAAADATETLSLVSLSEVQHVNALTENQRIDFNPRLTVVFGENATGKTGYVRILKRAAAVRSAEPILVNIRHGRAPSISVDAFRERKA